MLYVALGGAIGAAARYLIGAYIAKIINNTKFPIATIIINIIGSFLLGIFIGLLKQNDTLFLLFGTGFCGAFTTFSTFSVEALGLIQIKRFLEASIYIVISIVGSILAFVIGTVLIIQN
jgi:CrcB protein